MCLLLNIVQHVLNMEMKKKNMYKTIKAGADPGFFVGGGRTQKMGAIWPLWPPFGPQCGPSTGHIGTLGPISVFMGPILGQN